MSGKIIHPYRGSSLSFIFHKSCNFASASVFQDNLCKFLRILHKVSCVFILISLYSCVLKTSCCSLSACPSLQPKATSRLAPTESRPGNMQRAVTAALSQPLATSSQPLKNKTRRAPLRAQDLIACPNILTTAQAQTMEVQMRLLRSF